MNDPLNWQLYWAQYARQYWVTFVDKNKKKVSGCSSYRKRKNFI